MGQKVRNRERKGERISGEKMKAGGSLKGHKLNI